MKILDLLIQTAHVLGNLNIYELPVSYKCYSLNYNKIRKLYSGLENEAETESCILVQNNWDRLPTCGSMELFAYRLYEAERSCDVNIKRSKISYLTFSRPKTAFNVAKFI